MILPAARPRRPARIARLASAVAILGLSILQLCCNRATSSSGALRRGVPLERRIGGQERHDYPLTLAADQYLYVVVDQPGIDVTATLLGPGGAAVVASDDPDGRLLPERIALVAPVKGNYRLTIAPRNPKDPAGAYRIVLQEFRLGRSADGKRAVAEKEFAAGRGLERREDEKSLRQAVARYTEALDLWRGAEDKGGQVRALNELAQVERLLRESPKAWGRPQEAFRM